MSLNFLLIFHCWLWILICFPVFYLEIREQLLQVYLNIAASSFMLLFYIYSRGIYLLQANSSNTGKLEQSAPNLSIVLYISWTLNNYRWLWRCEYCWVLISRFDLQSQHIKKVKSTKNHYLLSIFPLMGLLLKSLIATRVVCNTGSDIETPNSS